MVTSSNPCFFSHHATSTVTNSFHLLLLFLNLELTPSFAVLSWNERALRLLGQGTQHPGISLVLSTCVNGRAALVLETHLNPVTREHWMKRRQDKALHSILTPSQKFGPENWMLTCFKPWPVTTIGFFSYSSFPPACLPSLFPAYIFLFPKYDDSNGYYHCVCARTHTHSFVMHEHSFNLHTL